MLGALVEVSTESRDQGTIGKHTSSVARDMMTVKDTGSDQMVGCVDKVMSGPFYTCGADLTLT
jgi:hypothetical protein